MRLSFILIALLLTGFAGAQPRIHQDRGLVRGHVGAIARAAAAQNTEFQHGKLDRCEKRRFTCQKPRRPRKLVWLFILAEQVRKCQSKPLD